PASPLAENSLRAAARMRSRVRFGSRTTARSCVFGETFVAMMSNQTDTIDPNQPRQATRLEDADQARANGRSGGGVAGAAPAARGLRAAYAVTSNLVARSNVRDG